MRIKQLLANFTPIIIQNHGKILIVAFFITLFMGMFAINVHFQEDMREGMPLEVDVFALRERVSDEFRGTEGIIVAISIDDEFTAEGVFRDIRNPHIIASILELHNRLEKEPLIYEVHSIAPIFKKYIPDDTKGVKYILNLVPNSNRFFNDDYSTVLVFATVDMHLMEGGGSREITYSMHRHLNSILKPAGVDMRMTGVAPLWMEMLEIMRSDKIITTSAATIIIFILLIILLQSFSKSVIVFTPLAYAVIWTYGSLTLLGISITMTTVMVGAVLIGIGVEYGVFIVSRFYEELKIHTMEDALIIAVSEIGSSTLGSALTTAAAFFSLTISEIPMIHDSGITLGIGIIFCWIASTVITPCFIIFREKLKKDSDSLHKVHKKKKLFEKILKFIASFKIAIDKFMNNLFKAYGTFLSKYTYSVIVILLIFTVFMFQQAVLIEIVHTPIEDWMPVGTEVADTFRYIDNEFPGLLSFVTIVLDSERDARDPKVLEFSHIISQQVETVDGVLDSESATDLIIDATHIGRIPISLNAVKNIINQNETVKEELGRFIDEDYSTSLIHISVMGDVDIVELKRNLERVTEIDAPYGTSMKLTGGVIEDVRLLELSHETMNKTAILSIIFIVVILLIIFTSFKYGLIPIVVIIVGVTWGYGIFVLFGINLTKETSGMLAMILGIGIDFGIQITSRYRYELELNKKHIAITKTMSGVFYPMVISAIAASIGFLCLKFGKLPIMGDIGTIMAIGVIMCIIASFTILPAILLVFTKSKRGLTKNVGLK